MSESDQNRTAHASGPDGASPSKAPSSDGASSSSAAVTKSEATLAPIAAPAPVDATSSAAGGDDEDMLLVTEFPPPPYYYTLASRQTPSHLRLTTPPAIPHRAFRVAAKKVNLERQKAREESERIRIEAEGGGGDNAMDLEKKGSTDSSKDDKSDLSATAKKEEEDDDSIDPNDPNEPVVAVFGEIVEDPTLVVEEECNDPVEIRENVKRLNRSVLNGFLKLVQKLVNDPNDNKKLRDELSHDLFLMLQECNKFREHQAREILISTLEQQLERRKEGLASLNKQISEADEALNALNKFRESS